MRPLLFYPNALAHRTDDSHQKFLETLFDVTVGTYNIEEHRSQYDHEHIPEYFPGTDILMPSTCWCDIPDPANAWPQLYFNPESADNLTGPAKFIAAGNDILSLSLSDIHKQYGTNITPDGDWEIA